MVLIYAQPRRTEFDIVRTRSHLQGIQIDVTLIIDNVNKGIGKYVRWEQKTNVRDGLGQSDELRVIRGGEVDRGTGDEQGNKGGNDDHSIHRTVRGVEDDGKTVTERSQTPSL